MFNLCKQVQDNCSLKYVICSQVPVENFRAADVEFQARFRHENIAELYGALLWDQNVHLFMEAGEGGSVLEKLDSCGPMREFEIIWVTKQILRGLQYLHSHNVIHHDIKRKSKRREFVFLSHFSFAGCCSSYVRVKWEEKKKATDTRSMIS